LSKSRFDCCFYYNYEVNNFGKRLTEVRKEKKISQDAVAKKIGVHGAVIGRYELDEVKPSIEVATQIAEVLEVSLDYLVGSTSQMLDNALILRIEDIQQLDPENRGHLFALMDAFLRDYKTKQAYAR
jgi:transcriptional regulator with XRE-family HTH domain